MAVKTNITINIVEPGSNVPVPDTGLFTHGIGGTETTAIGAVLILTIAAIIVTILYRKQKKAGKVTKLVHIIDSTKAVLKSKKRITAGLTALALLASAGTLTALLTNAGKSNTKAAEGDNGLTLDVSSKDLTIEVKDQPVFAVLPVQVTVEEATQAGYTLTAYTDNTDLVSTTNPNNKIPMVTVEGDELTTLQDNTWGLALDNEPEAKDNKVYTALSTDQTNPTILKSIDDYSETPAEDKTTIYYGFYITPDTPYGTYTGSDINYNVEPNYITNLSFNGNGNDGGEDIEGMTIIAGDAITLPANTYTKEGYNFIGWNTVAEPTEQDPGEAYEDQAEYTAVEGETKDVTLYAQWKKKAPYMQDVATWGSKLEIGDEIIAVDNRDSKEYYVARLADGNIWMTQNLDLDLSTDITLTPADTNVAEDWTPLQNTISGDLSYNVWNSDNNPRSYDPQEVYYYTSNNEEQDIQYDSYAECEAARHTDCAHYHAGNYYNWPAAVASNDVSSMITNFENATNSICPAGWRLPMGSDVDSTDYGEITDMVKKYDGILGPIQQKYGTDYHPYLDGGFNAIRVAPLWLTRAGLIAYGSFSNVASGGAYWSSSTRVSRTPFNENEFYPDMGTSKSDGYSVRCVAQ